jgi:hypothetical protein
MTKRGAPAGRAGAIGFALVGALLVAAPSPAPAADEKKAEPTAVEEILGILKKRGDIDEEEYQRLVTKNAKHEEKEKKFLPKILFSGDLRGRYESSWFADDVTGVDTPNRYRLRYRVRFGAQASINDYVLAAFRVASGEGDNRSTNTTLGRGVDFLEDAIFVDQAYLRVGTKKGQIPIEGGQASVTFGKMPNPFVWKSGVDQMLWDHDINPEGAALQLAAQPISELRTFASAGYFVLDENFAAITSTNKDPNLIAVQGGAELTPIEDVAIGSRLSWYGFHSLDTDFLQRGAAGTNGATVSAGNLRDGLTGSLDGGGFDVGEYAGYVTWSGVEGLPITLYGAISRNFDAEYSQIASNLQRGDIAWSAGVEVGDKVKWLKLGAGFFHVEANAFPSMLIDSDIADGVTNREAWLFTATRQIFPNTDLTFWVSMSDAIDESLARPAAANALLFNAPALSNVASDRIRARLDLEVKF